MGFEQVEFETVPATFRADREKDTGVGTGGEALTHRYERVRISDEPHARTAKAVEFILDDSARRSAPAERRARA